MKILLSPAIIQGNSTYNKKNVAEKKDNFQNNNQLLFYYAPINFQGVSKTAMNTSRHALEYYEGCLLGGAIGDAFGAKLEWLSLDKIKSYYGEAGLRYIPKVNGQYNISDDTQMTLFTAEGLLKALLNNSHNLLIEPNYKDIFLSYNNWYKTQTIPYENVESKMGLMADRTLYSQRFPGKTCMSALRTGKMGTIENPINNSAGNGGLMRIAPVGLMYCNNPELAFKVGAKCAAMTHGHPDGYLPAGFQAALIAFLIGGNTLETSIEKSMVILSSYKNSDNLMKIIKKAIILVHSGHSSEEAIKKLGMGGKADEALAIALYAALKEPKNLMKALSIAVNHDGDSDSTGAIAGNILGTVLGINSIKNSYIDNIELKNWLKKYSRALLSVSANSQRHITYTQDELQQRRMNDKFVI
ncbi:MAG: ADP-ribosylglycohydrolase family protein [Candidatus Gastranaerophilales bacterium]|nr:ADP-ribosylglycohydrolase family protein [Candidatus Gastranaerophilales bacterium]MCM1073314.1 ADP-ribosylglycohydrolase family protein [Bacteroides sp.]